MENTKLFAASRYQEKYDAFARILHWLVALLVAAQFVIGWTMPDVHRDTQPVGLIAWHLGVGATLIAAVVIRLLWRATHTPPPAPANLSGLQRVASRITHFLLYAALIAVPVLGWINASWRGWTIHVAGVLPLPRIADAQTPFGHPAGDIHSALAWVLFALIALHVAAALFHRVVLKDRVLERMLP